MAFHQAKLSSRLRSRRDPIRNVPGVCQEERSGAGLFTVRILCMRVRRARNDPTKVPLRLLAPMSAGMPVLRFQDVLKFRSDAE